MSPRLDFAQFADEAPVPHELSGLCGGGPPALRHFFAVAGRDKKLGKLTKTSVCSISSRIGVGAGTPALGKLLQQHDVNPTVAGPQKLYGLAPSHSSSVAGRQLRDESWPYCKLCTLKRHKGPLEHM